MVLIPLTLRYGGMVEVGTG